MRNVLDWKADRPDGRILSLVRNYRCPAPILDLSNRLFPDKPVVRKQLRIAGGGMCRSRIFRGIFLRDSPLRSLSWRRGRGGHACWCASRRPARRGEAEPETGVRSDDR